MGRPPPPPVPARLSKASLKAKNCLTTGSRAERSDRRPVSPARSTPAGLQSSCGGSSGSASSSSKEDGAADGDNERSNAWTWWGCKQSTPPSCPAPARYPPVVPLVRQAPGKHELNTVRSPTSYLPRPSNASPSRSRSPRSGSATARPPTPPPALGARSRLRESLPASPPREAAQMTLRGGSEESSGSSSSASSPPPAKEAKAPADVPASRPKARFPPAPRRRDTPHDEPDAAEESAREATEAENPSTPMHQAEELARAALSKKLGMHQAEELARAALSKKLGMHQAEELARAALRKKLGQQSLKGPLSHQSPEPPATAKQDDASRSVVRDVSEVPLPGLSSVEPPTVFMRAAEVHPPAQPSVEPHSVFSMVPDEDLQELLDAQQSEVAANVMAAPQASSIVVGCTDDTADPDELLQQLLDAQASEVARVLDVPQACNGESRLVRVNISFQGRKKEAMHKSSTTMGGLLALYEKRIMAIGSTESQIRVCDAGGLELGNEVTLGALQTHRADSGPIRLTFDEDDWFS